MNWNRGFKRIIGILSYGALVFCGVYGALCACSRGDILFVAFGLFSGVACFIGIWVIYWLALYIVRGFYDDGTEQKN